MSCSNTKISGAKLGALCLAIAVAIALAGCQQSSNDANNDAAPAVSSTAPMTTPAAPMNSMPATPQSASAAHDAMGTMSGSLSGSFAMQATTGGMTQIALADMALDKSSNAQIKTFAGKIKADRSAADNQLKSIASKDVVTMPTDMTTEQKATIAALKAKNGADFDKAYTETMTKLLQIAVSQFEDGSKTASTQDLRQFAASTLPNLKAQLNTAQSLQSGMGDESQPSGSGSAE